MTELATTSVNTAARVQRRGRLAERDIARATASDPATVLSWLTGNSVPTGLPALRLRELSFLLERLLLVLQPDYVCSWLRTHVPILDDEVPLDVIASGGYQRLSAVVAGLESPGVI
jgi:hypothetical protein